MCVSLWGRMEQGQRQLKAEQRERLTLLEGEGYKSGTWSQKWQWLMRLRMELEASVGRDQGWIRKHFRVRTELIKGPVTLLVVKAYILAPCCFWAGNLEPGPGHLGRTGWAWSSGLLGSLWG